ncbi:UGMP family protein [archaeon]|nr:UGMP family protein [archaeon]|tara:strand:- start:2994 stop:3971 length:978 start_codon:yes stop_codon:yes gene_type:complete
MISLGIESTAHTFGIGIFKDKECLSNAKDVYQPPLGSGMNPADVREHHENVKDDVLKESLEKAGIDLKDVDIVSYSAGPGLPPALKVGYEFAEELVKKADAELVPVNHCIAHIEIGKMLAECKDPVTLYVSGGNTQVLAFTRGKYRVFGETLDVAIGNAIDKVIRELTGKYPGGPEMQKLAENGKYIKMPYVVKGMNMSFSGISSEAIRLHKNKKASIEDISYSFQEHAYAMLTEVTERAMAHTKKKELLLTGGVAASKRLQEMLETMCKERGAEYFVVPFEFAGDNGAMIAWTGIVQHENKYEQKVERGFNQNWRTDEVDVCWI